VRCPARAQAPPTSDEEEVESLPGPTDDLSGTNVVARWIGRAGAALLPWALILAGWYAVRGSGLVEAALIPSPGEVARRFWVQLTEHNLLRDIGASLRRVLIGLGTAIVFAIPVGFLIGWYKPVRRFLDPAINFFRALPPIALIPLVIVYFGIGEFAKGVILFYAAFFASVIVMYEGISQTSPIYIRVARTLGATDFEIFWRVIVPLSVPHILTALRVALGICWGTLVASELVAAQSGLGAMIQNAGSYFQLDVIYVGILCIGTLALIMDLVLRKVAARLVAWQDRAIP
jgi:NitT/TauT family transport system permease protein